MIIFYILNLFQGKTQNPSYLIYIRDGFSYLFTYYLKISVSEKGCILSIVLIIFVILKNHFSFRQTFYNIFDTEIRR